MKEFELAVIVGRFQPLHNGHEGLLNTAFDYAEKVLVMVGSANRPRSLENPFTYEERKGLLLSFCEANGLDSDRLIIEPLNDFDYNDNLWEQNAWDTLVRTIDNLNVMFEEVCVVTSNKDNDADIRSKALDDSRFTYVNKVPRSGLYTDILSATSVREYWLDNDFDHLGMMVPEYTYTFLCNNHDILVKLWKVYKEVYKHDLENNP